MDTNIKELNLSKLHIKVPVLMENLATFSKKTRKSYSSKINTRH